MWYAQQPDMDFGGSDTRIAPCIPQVSALEAGDSGSALVRMRSATSTFAGSRAASSSQAARFARGEEPPKPTTTAGTTEAAGGGGGSSGDDD